MSNDPLRIELTRGPLVESVHRVPVAVVAASGHLLAAAGDAETVTWWRSAAKPFQALPLLEDGAAEHFKLSDEELALACASHSSEPRHLEIISRLMARLGLGDADLSCGVHTPLSPAVALAVARGAVVPTSRWSNCSGKHAGMLALAKYHGWPADGYNAAGHPVQDRVLAEVERWTEMPATEIAQSVDGCTAVCFGLPLRAMALAYARLGASTEAEPRRIVQAMSAHPFLVAGTGRLCTDLMGSWPGQIVAKVGAEGVYCIALPAFGLGVALKVEDGETRASGVAVLEVLQQLLGHVAPGQGPDFGCPQLARHGPQPLHNTRGTQTGQLRAAGRLHFFAQ
jgi:L-asparaginase II